MFIPFPEWTPDIADLNNPGMTVAKNVIPGTSNYKPVPALAAVSDALTAYPRGAIAARDAPTGVSYNFAGDATKLYSLGNTTDGIWDNVSKAAGYALGSEEGWSFTQFGDTVFAVAISETIQTYTMGTSTLFADIVSATGTAPLARYIDTVHIDFLVVANTYDAVDGFKPARVRWPGIGSSTTWAVSATTQADYQDLDEKLGWITQLVGGDYATIYQEFGITRMDYVGSPAIFQFTAIEGGSGTRYSKSIVKVGSLQYYLGLDGFYVFDGNQSIPIGTDKVNTFFFDDLDAENDHRITSAVDYINRLIVWSYPGSGNINGMPNRWLFYNFAPNAKLRWSYAEINNEYIFSSLTEGYTLDELDGWETSHGITPANLDLLPHDLDSRFWTGNQLVFGSFNSDHKLAVSSTTDYLTAVLETAEVELNEGQRTDLFRVMPYIDANGYSSSVVTVEIGVRNLQSGAVTYGSPISLDANGEIQCRSNARFHRMRTNIAGGFKAAVGVKVLEAEPAGYR